MAKVSAPRIYAGLMERSSFKNRRGCLFVSVVGTARPNLLLVPAASRFLCAPDLLGEHADVQRAGWLVLVNVLTLGLITLNEVPLRPSEAIRSTQTDQHRLRYLSRSENLIGSTFSILRRAARGHGLAPATEVVKFGRDKPNGVLDRDSSVSW